MKQKREIPMQVAVGSLLVSVPRELYERLAELADKIGLTVDMYILPILNAKNEIPEWNNFPPEAEVLLKLYRFCFNDSEATKKLLLRMNQ